MPINFQSLFQDTWNFVRNRAQFTLSAVVLLAALQLGISLIIPRSTFLEAAEGSAIHEQMSAIELLIPSMLSMLVIVFVNVLLILNIKSINNGDYRTFLHNAASAFSLFLQAILLTVVQVFPISLGLAFALFPTLGDSAPLLAMPVMLMGLFVFIKLNLVIYAYLIEEPRKTLGATLKFTWGLSYGRMLPLIMFTAIIYFIPTALSSVVGAFSAFGTFGVILAQALNAFVNLVMVIFSFRFYQSYRQ
ncbi:hypothetical protein V5G99_07775 [Bibersteinia trehalosi]|uniref:Beta-methylgalactoside transporter n=1 Tax=Bibersteinia trehalosi TaxID=47735 RepID=A0A3R8LCC4_BIBTR|nr:hypothetical protein [Bibersteinia trehalosi]RRN04632.1 hypothetical protein EIM44_04105 [Bibersteinia trehalosi]